MTAVEIDARTAVRRGYDALIAAGHTPEAIRAAVLADDLDMAGCNSCVIGRLYDISPVMGPDLGMQFGRALRDLGTDVEVHDDQYGFDIDDGITGDESVCDAYEVLADEWRRLVTEQVTS